MGIRKGGTSAHTGVKIESGRAIFSPWENPLVARRIRMDVDCNQYGSQQTIVTLIFA